MSCVFFLVAAWLYCRESRVNGSFRWQAVEEQLRRGTVNPNPQATGISSLQSSVGFVSDHWGHWGSEATLPLNRPSTKLLTNRLALSRIDASDLQSFNMTVRV